MSSTKSEIIQLVLRHGERVIKSDRFVKISLIAVGTLLATIGALFNGQPFWPITGVRWAAIIGAFLVFVGTLYFVFTADDTNKTLKAALKALDEAELTASETAELYRGMWAYEEAVDKLKELYAVYHAARGALEQSFSKDSVDEQSLIDLCFGQTKRSLRVAMGFELNDIWTIGIYRAYWDEQDRRYVLKCIAHHRSFDCPIEEARPWPEGVGVGGVAFAKNDEVVVPNLFSHEAGSAFRLNDDKMKPEDRQRYGSLFAVAVDVGNDPRPWGVVIATNSRPHHFGDENHAGLAPEEAVRALAGITALAIVIARANAKNIGTAKADEKWEVKNDRHHHEEETANSDEG
ncbi:MAG TPA: hypothetical protein VGO22_18475 [Pseudorhizobium sp.]|jgi:hypothetical protein|nr:hypothetical protein [Pseudorhizobium sp.]